MLYTIYTDASCLKNPNGPGGYAEVLFREGEMIEELSGGKAVTTRLAKNSTTPFLQSLRSRHACSSSSSSEVGMLDAVLPLKTENRPTVCQHADQGLQESAHRS
jgi:hypothetical protein